MSLPALAKFILHGLAFTEFFNGHALKLRVVEEQIVASSCDEPKAFFRQNLFYLLALLFSQ
jgi:hypothetical protein